MLEFLRELIVGILDNQFPVPGFLTFIHWWLGAILIVLVSGGGAVFAFTSIFDDWGEAGVVIGIFIFFLGGPIMGIVSLYAVLIVILFLLIRQWNTTWRFIGWRKF